MLSFILLEKSSPFPESLDKEVVLFVVVGSEVVVAVRVVVVVVGMSTSTTNVFLQQKVLILTLLDSPPLP